jgi:hypothetical protein
MPGIFNARLSDESRPAVTDRTRGPRHLRARSTDAGQIDRTNSFAGGVYVGVNVSPLIRAPAGRVRRDYLATLPSNVSECASDVRCHPRIADRRRIICPRSSRDSRRMALWRCKERDYAVTVRDRGFCAILARRSIIAHAHSHLPASLLPASPPGIAGGRFSH